MTEAPELCEECHTEPSVVGLGAPPRWLCQHCFEEALGRVQRLLRYATEAAQDGGRMSRADKIAARIGDDVENYLP